MRIPWTGKAYVALIVGLGIVVGAAAGGNEKPPPRTKKKDTTTTWWNPWGIGEKKTEKKPLPKADKDKEKQTAARADKEMTPEAKSATKLEVSPERTREQQTLFRRLDVCDELKLLATQKHDDGLMRQAEDLDARAWDVYTRRVAGIDAARAASGARDLEIGAVSPREENPTEVSNGRPGKK